MFVIPALGVVTYLVVRILLPRTALGKAMGRGGRIGLIVMAIAMMLYPLVTLAVGAYHLWNAFQAW